MRALAAAVFSGPAACVGEMAARVLEMGAHEPVELLELLGLLDQQVLGDGSIFSVSSIASRCDVITPT